MQTDVGLRCGGKRLRGIALESTEGCPLVTVITAVYDGQPYVRDCLESVLRQDYPNIEHIVMDGGSSDGTLDILRQYDDRIALWRSEPDRGIYDAWNKALLEAHGEWICFLGADDIFLPGAVSAYMKLASENPQAEFLSSKIRVVHPSGYERVLGRRWTWKSFSRTMCTLHAGTMHKRSLFDRLGKYDTSYRIVADYELLLRAGRRLNAAYAPVITVTMRDGGTSCTSIALDEQARAKAAAGRRNTLLIALELYAAKIKYHLRPLRYAWGGLMTKWRRSVQ